MTRANILQAATSIARALIVSALICLVFPATAQEQTKIVMMHHLPIVKGMINDKEAYFILDTGASVTLLNSALADEYGFDVVHNEYWENYVVSGLGGKHLIEEARNVIVQLGDQKLAFINKSCSLQRISRNFSSDKIQIAGIIGSDVMGALGSQIDMANNIVVFYQKPVEPILICKE